MSNFTKSLFTATALISAAVAMPVQAATTTTTFQVTANVLKACVVSAQNLAFGTYDPTSGAATDGSTLISSLCTIGTSYTLGLNPGTGTGATVTARKMTGTSSTLGYGLYQDSARTTNWGNTPGTDTPAAVVAPVGTANVTVYGRIPASQNVIAGNYTDTITVTLTY